ncbi:MAG TPA: lantibiotic immunity ABC transporter MutE/EpiE family permease subunit [Candidatus Pelethocola excrementipullorum]|nr:lantibiotic immunity ABC transporter MutE/EpiE family permease subunit [Candidatus Pelethocola excrementipullorum]
MQTYLKAELLKTKSTMVQKIIILVPFLCIITAVGFCFMGDEQTFLLGGVTAINHWGLLWLPAVAALIIGVLQAHEKKSTDYKMIYGTFIDLRKVWIAKCIVVMWYLVLATLIFWVMLIGIQIALLGNFTVGGTIKNLLALMLSLVAILWQIPVYYIIARKIPQFLLLMISVGIALTIAPDMVVKSFWWAVPFTWVLRVQSPFNGLHPNGVPLQEGDWFLSYAGFPVVIAGSIVLFVLSMYITTWIFNRKRSFDENII